MSERRPFLRPQEAHWWARAPYRAYTVRELCGVAIAVYAAILLAGLLCLLTGPRAFAAYQSFLASPLSLLIHLLVLAATLWHTYTWFQILPKTLPKLVLRGKLVPQPLVTRTAWIAAVVCSLLLVMVAIVAGAMS